MISAGKMSGLWSGQPASVKLDDLDVICAVLDCPVEQILTREPDTVPRPREPARTASGGQHLDRVGGDAETS